MDNFRSERRWSNSARCQIDTTVIGWPIRNYTWFTGLTKTWLQGSLAWYRDAWVNQEIEGRWDGWSSKVYNEKASRLEWSH